MTDAKLRNQYDEIWANATSQFKQGRCEVDSLIDDPNDDRRGVTLLARPDKETLQEIVKFQHALRSIAPEQYYYPPSDIHLTILSIISCYQGFRWDGSGNQAYFDLIKNCLRHSIEIQFAGITASPAAILIQGFPFGSVLDELREALRQGFKASSLEHSIDSRYRINTAHLTVMRFRKPLNRPEEFMEVLSEFREEQFGRMRIESLHLVSNDWYQRKDKVDLLNTFALAREG